MDREIHESANPQKKYPKCVKLLKMIPIRKKIQEMHSKVLKMLKISKNTESAGKSWNRKKSIFCVEMEGLAPFRAFRVLCSPCQGQLATRS